MNNINILKTDANNWGALFARVAIAITIFPHGAQKLFGWFGGGGFEGTMQFLTTGANLPWIVAFLVIIIEVFCPIFLLMGFMTRIAAFGILVNFIGVVVSSFSGSGFFMNWGRAGGQPEGIEYFILLFGLTIISMIAGGGKASIDAILFNKNKKTQPKLA